MGELLAPLLDSSIQTQIKTKISFGASGYSDYTKHHDDARKQMYLKRHTNENPNDPKTVAFYATNLLWNKTTLNASVDDTNRKYKGVHITMK